MVGHDLHFQGSPSIARQRCVPGSDEKEPLICHDALAVRQSQLKLPPPYLWADVFHVNAGLFLKLTERGFFERFSVLDTAPRCSPIVLARQCPVLVDEAEE